MKLSPVLAALLVAACAKQPGGVAPAMAPASAYANFSCPELTHMLVNERARLRSLEKEQKQAAAADAVGVFLFLIPVGSVFGADQEAELAISKGKVQGMEQQMLTKRC